MEAHDYKIEYKNCKDDVPHVKYIHALNHETAETIFKEDWIYAHGDDNAMAEFGTNKSYSCEIMDVSVLSRDHRWVSCPSDDWNE